MTVKLILRDKEYLVKPGMTLRSSLGKIGLQVEAYLATREGEMITEDEILNDGEVIRLIAVISGGATRLIGAGRS
jgi:sulfur carrier protein ThiS